METEMDSEEELDALVRAAAREARQTLGPHPPPEELLGYHAGTWRGEAREQVQGHLALCPDCARAVLDLAAFPRLEPVHPEDEPDDAAVAAEWRRFRARARAEPLPRLALARLTTSGVAWGLAASLLLATVGLSVWISRLRGELSRPRADIRLVDLVPGDTAERSTAPAAEVHVPPATDRIVFILNLGGMRALRSWPEYRVEIASADGRVAWSRRGIARSP